MGPGSYDVAVVGGGIVGLACAWSCAGRGLSVVLLERDARQTGASVRNFGLVWPIGMPAGPLLRKALFGRERWIEAARIADFWHDPCGSMHAAYHDDELAVLQEVCSVHGAEHAEILREHHHALSLLSPKQALARAPWLVPDGLKGALLSSAEVCVDPRQAIGAITRFLGGSAGVRVVAPACVWHIDPPLVACADGREFHARRVLVCAGEDVRTLYPSIYQGAGLRPCKLQMMKTVAQQRETGGCMEAVLASGATLRHYRSFEVCPSLARVRERFARERPEFDRWGIHVLACQHADARVTIGDSHEYDDPPSPFSNERIDRAILDYLATFVRLPDPRISERWIGVYTKAPAGVSEVIAKPHPAVTVVTGVGGTGMTLAFALAEQVCSEL